MGDEDRYKNIAPQDLSNYEISVKIKGDKVHIDSPDPFSCLSSASDSVGYSILEWRRNIKSDCPKIPGGLDYFLEILTEENRPRRVVITEDARG